MSEQAGAIMTQKESPPFHQVASTFFDFLMGRAGCAIDACKMSFTTLFLASDRDNLPQAFAILSVLACCHIPEGEREELWNKIVDYATKHNDAFPARFFHLLTLVFDNFGFGLAKIEQDIDECQAGSRRSAILLAIRSSIDD